MTIKFLKLVLKGIRWTIEIQRRYLISKGYTPVFNERGRLTGYVKSIDR